MRDTPSISASPGLPGTGLHQQFSDRRPQADPSKTREPKWQNGRTSEELGFYYFTFKPVLLVLYRKERSISLSSIDLVIAVQEKRNEPSKHRKSNLFHLLLQYTTEYRTVRCVLFDFYLIFC